MIPEDSQAALSRVLGERPCGSKFWRIMKLRLWTVAFLVIVVCISTGMLGAVYFQTEARVRRNERIRVKQAVLEVFHIQHEEVSVEAIFEENIDVQNVGDMLLYRPESGGVAFEISGPGFWGIISALIALEPDMDTIRGLRILENSETPGLGGRIAEDWFQQQFRGKKVTPELRVVPYRKAEGPNEVDAISGATQTSRAFERIVNRNIRALYQKMHRIGG